MVKIVIMNRKEIFEKTIRDVEAGKVQKEDKILYFDSLDTLRKLLTKQRIRMLKTITEQKPESIYDLSKIMAKDFKNTQTDAKILESFGLIKLEPSRTGNREKLKPTSKIKKLEMVLSIS